MTLLLILLAWFSLAFGVALILGRLIAGPKVTQLEYDPEGHQDAIEELRRQRDADNQKTLIFWSESRKRQADSQRRRDENRAWANERASKDFIGFDGQWEDAA